MDQHRTLAGLMARHCPDDGLYASVIPRVSLIRASRPTDEIHAVQQPGLCIIAQGAKRVMLGDLVLEYDPAKYLVVSVDLPVIGQVTRATPEEPYLCLLLDLDLTTVTELVLTAALPAVATPPAGPAFGLSACGPDMLDAAARLLRLLDSPADIPVLAPLIEREMLYRLLMGEQSERLRQIAHADPKLVQVGRAIDWIKRNYQQTLRIDALAEEAGMSPSSLHQHFKAVTAMSPLQYQKQLRLQEARRMLLAQAVDAATAGFHVGYESPSQFSREYRRLFGAPPLRDVARLREAAGPLA